MQNDHVNLVKLCVGIDSVEHLIDWRARRDAGRAADGLPPISEHVTRMFPKRAREILRGGSLYWVIKGQIQARQRIVGLEERIGQDGIRRCALILDPELIRTRLAPRRPFQGWRYLAPQDAPPDLPKTRADDDELPPELSQALAEIGLR